MKKALLVGIITVLGVQAQAKLIVSQDGKNLGEKQLCSSEFHTNGTPQGTSFALRVAVREGAGCALGEGLTTIRISNLSLSDSAVLLSRIQNPNEYVNIDFSISMGAASLNTLRVR